MQSVSTGEHVELVGRKITHWAINGRKFAVKRHKLVCESNPDVVVVMAGEPMEKLDALTSSSTLVVYPKAKGSLSHLDARRIAPPFVLSGPRMPLPSRLTQCQRDHLPGPSAHVLLLRSQLFNESLIGPTPPKTTNPDAPPAGHHRPNRHPAGAPSLEFCTF